MNLLGPVKDAVARHSVATFLLIGIGVYVAAALISALVDLKILPFDLPLYGVLGGILGVGLAAFVVTAATDGRAGVEDLLRRSLRWRVPARWYLIALLGVPVTAALIAIAIYGTEAVESPPGGWPRALGAVLVVFVLQLALFQTGGRDRLDRLPPGPMAGPLQPAEAQRNGRAPVGRLASPGLLRRRRLGDRTARQCAVLPGFRVHLVVLRASPDRVAVRPDGPKRPVGGDLPRQLRRIH
jgi:hypothetical protein